MFFLFQISTLLKDISWRSDTYKSTHTLKSIIHFWKQLSFFPNQNQQENLPCLKDVAPLFSKEDVTCYFHIIIYHSVDIIKDRPEHALGPYSQQAFEACNRFSRYESTLNVLLMFVDITLIVNQASVVAKKIGRNSFFKDSTDLFLSEITMLTILTGPPF